MPFVLFFILSFSYKMSFLSCKFLYSTFIILNSLALVFRKIWQWKNGNIIWTNSSCWTTVHLFG